MRRDPSRALVGLLCWWFRVYGLVPIVSKVYRVLGFIGARV